MIKHLVTIVILLATLLSPTSPVWADRPLRFDVGIGGGGWVALGLGEPYRSGAFGLEFRAGGMVHRKIRLSFRQTLSVGKLPFTTHRGPEYECGLYFPSTCSNDTHTLGGNDSNSTVLMSTALVVDFLLHDRFQLGLFAGILWGGQWDVNEWFVPKVSGGVIFDIVLAKSETLEWILRTQLEVGVLDWDTRAVVFVPNASFVFRF